MSENNIYRQWKRSRSAITPPKGFSNRVMERIHTYENIRKSGVISGLLLQLDFLPNTPSRIAFVLGLTAAGLFRISYTAINILIP